MNLRIDEKFTRLLHLLKIFRSPRSLVLVFMVALSLFFSASPVVVYGCPLFLSEGILLCVFLRASPLEAFAAVVSFGVVSVLFLQPGWEGYLAPSIIFLMLVVARLPVFKERNSSPTQAIFWAYALVLLTLGCIYQIQYSNFEFTKLALSRKVFEAIVCTCIFQLIDKSLIYFNSRRLFEIPLFPSQISIKEYVQGLVAVSCAFLVILALVAELNHSQRDTMALANAYITERASRASERVMAETQLQVYDGRSAETSGRDNRENPGLPIADPSTGFLDVTILRVKSDGVIFDESFPINLKPAANVVSQLERGAYAIVAPEDSGNDVWRIVARFGINRVAVYTFSNVDAMNSLFSSHGLQVQLAAQDLGGASLSEYHLRSSGDVKANVAKVFYDDNLLSIWSRTDSRTDDRSMLSLAQPDNSFLTYRVDANVSLGLRHWTFVTTITAWPLVVDIYSDYINLSLLGFSLVFILIVAFGILVQETLEPIRGYTSDIHSNVSQIMNEGRGPFVIPAVKKSVILELNESQESFNVLFQTLSALGTDMQDSVRAYEHLMSTMPLGVIAVDSQDNTVFVNEGLAEICKLSVSALAEIKAFSKPMKNHKAGDQELVVPITSGDGTSRELAIIKTQRISKGGIDDGYWAITVDLTKEKIKDAQLAQASKLATLGQMSTEIAHELNQPLNVLSICQSHISLALSQPEIDRDKINGKLKRMKMAVDRAARIINHMRTYGRVDTGNVELTDLREAINGALTLTGDQMKLTGVDVHVELPETPLKVMIDLHKVEQVLLNLLSNARDAVLENADSPRINIETEAVNGMVFLRVRDNGGGVPEGDVFKIFEPFWTTKLAGEGTGLGGSISYGIIKDMGGKMYAENVSGGLQVVIQLTEVGGELEMSKSTSEEFNAA